MAGGGLFEGETPIAAAGRIRIVPSRMEPGIFTLTRHLLIWMLYILVIILVSCMRVVLFVMVIAVGLTGVVVLIRCPFLGHPV